MSDLRAVRLALIFLLLPTLIFVGSLLINNSRDNVAINIEVVPSDSEVFINSKKARQGKNLVNIGQYSVSAKKGGFDTYSIKINVNGNEDEYAGLILLPVEASQKDYYEKNKNENSKKERISGQNVQALAEKNLEAFPLLEQLPVNFRYFSIDYGKSIKYPDDPTKIALYIKGSLPPSRQMATDWILDQGFNPIDYEIIFTDFINPFQEGD